MWMLGWMRNKGWRCCQEVDAFPPLDDRSLHGYWTVDIMQLKVKSAGIADGVAFAVSAPQRCSCCPTVSADEMLASRRLLLVVRRAASAVVVSSCTIAIAISRTWLCILLLVVCCGCCSWFNGGLVQIGRGTRLGR